MTEPRDGRSPEVEKRASDGLDPDDTPDREFELTNEFATVRVMRVHTRNGVRLQISSPRLGRVIRLDPLALESLTWQTSETFAEFLRPAVRSSRRRGIALHSALTRRGSAAELGVSGHRLAWRLPGRVSRHKTQWDLFSPAARGNNVRRTCAAG